MGRQDSPPPNPPLSAHFRWWGGSSRILAPPTHIKILYPHLRTREILFITECYAECTCESGKILPLVGPNIVVGWSRVGVWCRRRPLHVAGHRSNRAVGRARHLCVGRPSRPGRHLPPQPLSIVRHVCRRCENGPSLCRRPRQSSTGGVSSTNIASIFIFLSSRRFVAGSNSNKQELKRFKNYNIRFCLNCGDSNNIATDKGRDSCSVWVIVAEDGRCCQIINKWFLQ